MIVSVSRRTDIPAFYSEWFINRLKDGFVYVRNPMNRKQVSEISLKKEDVDSFVFWTKNPEPMIPLLEELEQYYYYFQFTLTPYGNDIEQNLPDKDRLIDTFIKLSEIVGTERVVWRYDPILLSEKYTLKYHINSFEYFAERLHNHTEKCVISFVDMYKKCSKNLKSIGARELSSSEVQEISRSFMKISRKYSLELESCAEPTLLQSYGIRPGSCIDKVFIERITGRSVKNIKDTNQRDLCNCLESVDIGEYNTCRHNCLYCYANYSFEKVKEKSSNHLKESPLLIGLPLSDDIVKKRKNRSLLK